MKHRTVKMWVHFG